MWNYFSPLGKITNKSRAHIFIVYEVLSTSALPFCVVQGIQNIHTKDVGKAFELSPSQNVLNRKEDLSDSTVKN